jgi:hypothetical protein
MRQLTNEEKAKIYNNMLNQYQRLQEEVRLIKAQDINVSESNQKRINFLESRMKQLYQETKKLYI